MPLRALAGIPLRPAAALVCVWAFSMGAAVLVNAADGRYPVSFFGVVGVAQILAAFEGALGAYRLEERKVRAFLAMYSAITVVRVACAALALADLTDSFDFPLTEYLYMTVDLGLLYVVYSFGVLLDSPDRPGRAETVHDILERRQQPPPAPRVSAFAPNPPPDVLSPAISPPPVDPQPAVAPGSSPADQPLSPSRSQDRLCHRGAGGERAALGSAEGSPRGRGRSGRPSFVKQ